MTPTTIYTLRREKEISTKSSKLIRRILLLKTNELIIVLYVWKRFIAILCMIFDYFIVYQKINTGNQERGISEKIIVAHELKMTLIEDRKMNERFTQRSEMKQQNLS